MPKILILLVLLGLPSLSHAREPTFERDIQPILTRFGCNAGACHGKARGQNGFSLSLLAYDPDADFAAITEEARGRRLFPANPEFSLLLRKASGEVPHGGGKKLSKDDPNYATLKQWIASGMPRTPTTAAKLVGIAVSPRERIMTFGTMVPLQITATYSDGSTEDVTRMSQFQSNDSTYAAVDAFGKIVAGPLPGEAAVMARFQNTFAVCNILIPLPGTVDAKYYETLPRKNFIDGHVWNKLKQLAITPSDPCPDATFHRRAFLDIIGRLPTPSETTAFLKDTDPKKRDALIDRLLERPEYGDFWANKWADLLRPNPYHAGIKATFNYDAWIRESFRKNKPYDQFVREILTAQGSSFRNGAVVFYRNRRQPDELTTMASQLFLGIRLDCAKCHHHPFEVYSQDDFYSFAAFFARLGHTGQGISAPISGGEEIFYVNPTGTVKHPLTDKAMSPHTLLGKDIVIPPEDDPRVVLAKWVTAPENPTFAKVIANRVWADLMGRGIVDPVDDLRATNPPTNGPLLDELAADFRKGGCNMKSLIRRIATSHAYGLNSTPRDRNIGDIRNYSRHYRQRLRAEVLLDAVTDITGVTEKFEAMSPGSRAMESWTVRFDSKFLDSFGRPDPNQDPPCERSSETTVVQALHLMNSPNIQRKITDDNGNAAILAKSDKTPAAIVREIYLLIYCREPIAEETAKCVARFEKKNAIRREATEDLMWALLNTPEFTFNDLLKGTNVNTNCLGVTRRDCLQLGLTTLLGGGLATAMRASSGTNKIAPKAKSCILIWMDGGPTHYETFDPKPDAPSEYRGDFKAIPTKTNGMMISEHMKRLAAISDKLAIVRSIRHDQGNHGAGNHYMMTGAPPRIPVGCGAFVSFHPSMGSVTAAEVGAPAGLPAYFSLPSMTRSGGPNFLGAKYAPFVVEENPDQHNFRVRDVALPSGLTAGRFADRSDVRVEVDRFRRFLDKTSGDPAVALDEHYLQAAELMKSKEAQAAFNIGREPEKVRQAYTRTAFGQRALLARRLVEAGVPFITLHDGGWDHHTKLFDALKTRLPSWDQVVSALISDLDQRGLLDTTLVIALGEFGRTPQINKDAGRDHWANAMSVLFAGGGTPGGQVIGATDKKGFAAIERVVSPENFASTIYTKLGIDPNKLLYAPNGRPSHIVSDPMPIKELMG